MLIKAKESPGIKKIHSAVLTAPACYSEHELLPDNT